MFKIITKKNLEKMLKEKEMEGFSVGIRFGSAILSPRMEQYVNEIIKNKKYIEPDQIPWD